MEDLSVQAHQLQSCQLRTGADVPVTDRLTGMSASAVPELQHGQPIPSYGELSSLKTRVVGDGRPGSVSHGGLLTLTGTPLKTFDTVSAGGINDYWQQLESLETALLPVLAPVGGGGRRHVTQSPLQPVVGTFV